MAYAIFNGSNPDRPTRVISPVFADFESAHREAGHCGQWHYVGKVGDEAVTIAIDYCNRHGLDYHLAWIVN
jgi:hypothetical protein